ncbi:MAG: NAD-binding protein [Campylobacterota bacterium]|nr:NAD-binding protein [Campylobacterota bacterium]
MSNKVIIYSFSKIAIQIAKVLQQKKYHIIIVEEDIELSKKAKQNGYEVQNISLMEDENILSLGVTNKETKSFFCVSDDKHKNLFVTLSVRNLNKELKIISVSFTKEDNKTMLLAGANKIINPYEIGALRIFRSLHKPLILDVLDNILFSESNIEVFELTIQKGSIFDGVYLSEINITQKYNLIILGIQDKEISDKFIFYSSGISHKVDFGDTLVVLGYSNDLLNFKKLQENNIKH